MPMPKPKPGEKQDDYVSRCMGDDAMAKEYPDEKQRSTVAHSMWKESKKKSFELSDLCGSLGERFTTSRWGIGNALQYVKAYGQNGAAVFGITQDAWTKEMDSAADRLTYCDETSGDVDFIVKSIREGTDISPGAVLEYDAMMVTKRRDRDGDILEPMGLDIDVKMPLLAHHVQAAPYGKHVAIVKQDDDVWASRWAIADFPLGRDMAVLTRFGAIRKSHGFKPIPGEFEPLEVVKAADGSQKANGWHIKKAGVYEGSGVSIPSNVDGRVLAIYEKQFDGICTAFSRDKLETDAMKCWAKSMFDQRPVVSRGVDLEAMAEPKAAESSEPIATKSVADTLDDYEFPGSYEWVRDNLQRELMNGLSRRSVYIAATFAKYAIICQSEYTDKGRKVECYKQTWANDDDGKPKFTGEAVEIEVKPQVIEKMEKVFDDLKTKSAENGGIEAGQVLSIIEERERSIAELSRELAAKAIASDDESEAIEALEMIQKALGAVRQQQDHLTLEQLFAD